MTIRWLSGFHTAPAKSECGNYVIKLLASPEFHYAAYFRASLYDLNPCGKAVPTLDEAKEQAQAYAERLRADAAGMVA
jgi:hypothetical protein